MGGWVDGWMDRWMDGWMDRWMDGWMDRWLLGAKEAVYLHVLFRVERSDWMIRFGEIEKLVRNVRGLRKYTYYPGIYLEGFTKNHAKFSVNRRSTAGILPGHPE